MNSSKVALIQNILKSAFPFVLMLGFFCLGVILSILLVKHESNKVVQYLRRVIYIIFLIFLVAIALKIMRQSTIWNYHHIFLFSFISGIVLRLFFSKISLIRVKGKAHKMSEDFYLGKSIPLHKKYRYALENKVVKSSILTHHQLIYGASGSGKTFSTLQPQCYFDIKWNRRLFIIDPKGDLDFSNSVFSFAKNFNREKDYFFFSITNPKISHVFNPLLGITNNEIKDLIISCTEWSEPYYKKMAEMLLLNVLEKIDSPTFSEIEKRIPDEIEFKGLKADLKIICKSDFGKIIDNKDAPSIEQLHRENKICFFSLNTQAYPETSKQIGKIILGSLMALSNKIQANIEESNRKETTIIVDEFGSFITETFINFLNKARSSKFRLILATQSPGDVEIDGQKTRKQVSDSTTIKIFMRVSDPDSAEYCSSLIGTHSVIKRTSRIDDRNFVSDTYTGSIRETQEFIIHPDEIKKFKIGEGVLYTQAPFSVSKVDFDFAKNHKIKFFNYLDSAQAKMKIDEFNLLNSISKKRINQAGKEITAFKENVERFN